MTKRKFLIIKNLLKYFIKNRYFISFIRFIESLKPNFYNKEKVAIAVYDLEVNPTTFDFVWFLYEANIYFKSKGLTRFNVIIKPSSLERKWEVDVKYSEIIKKKDKIQRIYNIILPQAQLFYECKDVHLVEDKVVINRMLIQANYTYPVSYTTIRPIKMSINKVWEHTEKPIDFKGFSASSKDLDHVKKWLTLNDVGSRFVSISFTVL